MRLQLCAVGRMKAGAERDLFTRYQDRLAAAGRSVALGPVEVAEIEESRARRPEDRRAEEAERLVAAIAPGAVTVLLDEGGKGLSSEAFAARIGVWRDRGVPSVVFLVGGADGHGPAARDRAELSLPHGPKTWPHPNVPHRLMEPLNPAPPIQPGPPYHPG